MERTQLLLERLEAVGRSLAAADGALALIGLGSVGRGTNRLDVWSDLDFYVIVTPESRPRFLSHYDWLAAAAPLVFVHRSSEAGIHVLFADAIYAEMAVFTPEQLALADYEPGRIVWKQPHLPDSIAHPAVSPPPPPERVLDWLLEQVLCNLYVGLSRYRRGEKLAAAREIQLYALERMLELAPFLEPETSIARDVFAPMRRFEQRFPRMAAHLPAFQPGYDRTPEAAAAMLDFLAARFPLNEAMVAAIRRLLPVDA